MTSTLSEGADTPQTGADGTSDEKRSEEELGASTEHPEADIEKQDVSEGTFRQSENASLTVDIGDYYKAVYILYALVPFLNYGYLPNCNVFDYA